MKIIFALFLFLLSAVNARIFYGDAIIHHLTRRQIVTGQSVVSTPGGGLAPVPPGSMVVDAFSPFPGLPTNPFSPSVVSVAGGGLMTIPPGSKIVPGK
uniref:Uncharacterized protein n=1 Tax=Panagrolaimus sp. PS1159 TaxID=55785 RepID=A0AC35GJP9_9BILA